MTEVRTNPANTDELGPLSPYVNAAFAAAPSSAQASHAQDKLLARLLAQPEERSSRATRRPALWAASGAACVMVVLVLSLLPARSSIAFDDIRAFLDHFQSLKSLVTMRSAGTTVWAMEAVSDSQNRARIDFDYGMTFVVDPVAGEMAIINHSARSLQRIPIESMVTAVPGEGQEWLGEIRDFQGAAALIEAPRVINGIDAVGYRLETGRQLIEVWANAVSGEPMQVNVTSVDDQSFELQVDIWLDEPIDPAQFSLDAPHGYAESSLEPR